MSSGNKVFPLVEENSPKSSDKKKKENHISNKNNIDINKVVSDFKLKKKRSEEDEKSTNSAEFSGQVLQYNDYNKAKSARLINPIIMSKKAYEKYTERLKERTMRIEVEKIYKESEKLKRKYEEKNSNLHLFDNNPQFQKMLKMVEKQIKYFFIEGVILIVFSAILYFNVTRRKEGLALASFCLSAPEVAICIILYTSLKIGLLNDPDLSKAFRVFVIFESLLMVISFFLNVVSGLISIKYLKKIDQFVISFLVCVLFLLMIICFFVVFKSCLNLFVESALILFHKKTEYSNLLINEINSKNDMNFNTNLSMSNNLTTEALNKESTNIFNIDNNQKEENKEEEQYKTFSYFNKFHYSVTSTRNKEYNVFKKG
jgi:uncharacterized membrane protein required for colicin V production